MDLKTKKKDLFLLRGLPGSGKSTIAHLLSEGGKYNCFSIDDYFTNEKTGEYVFKFDENHLAYKKCEESVREEMVKGAEKIVVHYTFTIEWEMEIYFSMAKTFGYRIHVLTVENRHGNKNIHSVGEEQLKKMEEKYKIKLK